MLNRVRILLLQEQRLVDVVYAARTVSGHLFGDRQMQGHVQKWVGFALFRVVLALQGLVLVEYRMILGVVLDHSDQLVLKRGEGLLGLKFLPGGGKLAAQGTTVIAEHVVHHRWSRGSEPYCQLQLNASTASARKASPCHYRAVQDNHCFIELELSL